MKTTSRRSVILLGVKSASSLFMLFIVTIIIHEGAHYITSLLLGIPIVHFTWFDPNYFAPVFISASRVYTAGMRVVSYAGGLFTGILLLSILIFRWNWFKQSLYRWFLGFYLATFGSWQICQGILEGAFHQIYISNATNLLLSPTHYIGYVSAFAGMALYCILMPRFKEPKI